MEWTNANVIGASFLEFYKATDDLYDVYPVLYLLYRFLWDHAIEGKLLNSRSCFNKSLNSTLYSASCYPLCIFEAPNQTLETDIPVIYFTITNRLIISDEYIQIEP